MSLRAAVDVLVAQCHDAAAKAGWWTDLGTGGSLRGFYVPGVTPPVNVGERLMLIVSELAEGMEGARKGRMDDHLPLRPMLEVELADAVIRIADLAGGLGLDLGGAVADKLDYNRQRADHTLAARRAVGGKAW